MLKIISLNNRPFLLLLVTLIIFISISIPVDAAAPKVSVSTSFSSHVDPEDTSQLNIVVSETGGLDWIKDATVGISVSPSDGIYLSKTTSNTVTRINKLSSANFAFPIQVLDNAPSGEKTIHITVRYYEMDLFNIDTYGPYFVTLSKTFYVNDQYGTIEIVSNPSGANVYLDGVSKGVAPLRINNVLIGSHTIKLTKSGYNDVSSTVTVSSDKTSSVSKTLTVQSGSISVSSNPSGVNIYLDGTYKGTTPTTLHNVPIGSHTVKLTKSGYNDVSSTVTVSSGQTSSVSKTLATQTGSISVSSNPSGANVYLDGTSKGTTPTTLHNVPIGSHTVKLTKSGYNDVSSTVTVSSGQTSSVSKTLATQTGSISVSSNPSGAKIYYDGKYMGTSPKTLSSVPIGTHTIKLTKTGYSDISKTVTVTSGKTAQVSKSLSANPILAIGGIFLLLFPIIGIFFVKRKKPNALPDSAITSACSDNTNSQKQSTSKPITAIKSKEKSINIKSAFGYKGATIQYKIKIENPTPEPIGDIKVNLYVPDVFLVSEITKTIGMLKPDEAKTVTFEIRPTGECGDCEVSGKVIYYDYLAKKTSEIDIPTKSLSIVCPMLKVKEINESEWHNIVGSLVETEENTREIDMPAETLFAMLSRIVKDMHMYSLKPEITGDQQIFNGVARFYGEGVKELKYAAQIEVVGGAKKSKLILKAWAEREDALTGFYHGILDELEKRVHVKGYIDDSIVQNFYHNGDNIGTQVKDSFVYKSNVGNVDADTCPQCGKEKTEGEPFCSGCGTKFE